MARLNLARVSICATVGGSEGVLAGRCRARQARRSAQITICLTAVCGGVASRRRAIGEKGSPCRGFSITAFCRSRTNCTCVACSGLLAGASLTCLTVNTARSSRPSRRRLRKRP